MKSMHKIATLFTITVLLAGAVQATENNKVKEIKTGFWSQKWTTFSNFVQTKKDSLVKALPKRETIKKQLHDYVVNPVSKCGPALGGIATYFNPVIGGSTAGLGTVTRVSTNYNSALSLLSKCWSIAYPVFTAALETGSSFALTNGIATGNQTLIIAGALGSLLRLGCFGAEKFMDKVHATINESYIQH